MESATQLYHTMVAWLSQHQNWVNLGHLYTLAKMLIGLIQSGTVHLTDWIRYVKSRAKYAQSTQRRFSRWLQNQRIHVHELDAPLVEKALLSWSEPTIYLGLDTTRLWGQY